MSRTSQRALTAALLLLGCAAALAIRVVPPWRAVFQSGAVAFQEGDAWFHVRTVHNLLAHFPSRSGFDPYVFFPGGQNVPTGPLWDYLIATVAWVLGLGSPSPSLIDAIAALLPAILGSLYVIPAFFLARRFFGGPAAGFAALWMALACGGFLWYTHLGLADHHAAEGLFAFLALSFVCAAIEEKGRARPLLAILGGLTAGAFLATRPAGIFVPATLACVAAWDPLAAGPVLIALCTAAVTFIPVTGNQWAAYAWLSLGGGVLSAAGSLVFSRFSRRRGWPLLGAAAVALLVAAVARPGLLGSLIFEIRRVAGAEPSSRIVATVQEMQPVYRSGHDPGLPSVLEQLGTVWLFALPVLVLLCWQTVRNRRPALALLTIWTLVMTVATALQARMVIYFVPVAAVLAGAACAGITDLRRPKWEFASRTGLACIVALLNIVPAVGLLSARSSQDTDWFRALAWLRRNSPEPFGDASIFYRYYPRRASTAPVPAAADWGVAVWWEHGYEVEQVAHRVPMSNGTQSGAEEMARFFTDPSPDSAVHQLRVAGGRYIILDPSMPLFAGENFSRFPAALQTLGLDLHDYLRALRQADGPPLFVYLPAYYRTVTARLYLADGAAVPGAGPWLFGIGEKETVLWSRHYDSEKAADDYVAAHPLERLLVGCLDPGVSCFALPAVDGVREVFTSDPQPISRDRIIHAVKIFEVSR